MKNEEMSHEKYHDYQKYVEDQRNAEPGHLKEPERFADNIGNEKYHDYQDYIAEKRDAERDQREWEESGIQWHQLPDIRGEFNVPYKGGYVTEKQYKTLCEMQRKSTVKKTILMLLAFLVITYAIYRISLTL